MNVACPFDPSTWQAGFAPNRFLVSGFPNTVEAALAQAELTDIARVEPIFSVSSIPEANRTRPGCDDEDRDGPHCDKLDLAIYFSDAELPVKGEQPKETSNSVTIYQVSLPCGVPVVDKINAVNRFNEPPRDPNDTTELDRTQFVFAQPDYRMTTSAPNSDNHPGNVGGHPTDNSNPIGEGECPSPDLPDHEECCNTLGDNAVNCPFEGGIGDGGGAGAAAFAPESDTVDAESTNVSANTQSCCTLEQVSTEVAAQTDQLRSQIASQINMNGIFPDPQQPKLDQVRVILYENYPKDAATSIPWAIPDPLTVTVMDHPVPANSSGIKKYRTDHGIFTAGLVHNFAPEATIEIERVLSDGGDGWISTLITALDALVQKDGRLDGVIIHLGLGIAIPTNKQLQSDEIKSIQTILAQSYYGQSQGADGIEDDDNSAINGAASPQVAEWASWSADDIPEKALEIILHAAELEGATIVAAAGNDASIFIGQHGGHAPAKPAAFASESVNKFARLIPVAAGGSRDPDKKYLRACYGNEAKYGNDAQSVNGVVVFAGSGRPPGAKTACAPYNASYSCYLASVNSDGDIQCDALIGLSLNHRQPLIQADGTVNWQTANNGHAYWLGSSFAAAAVSGFIAQAMLAGP